MWLPKDERKLLASYYAKAGKTREIFELPIYEAMKILGFKENKASGPTTDEKWAMAFNANDNLKDRKLIDFELDEHVFKINLTLKGLDLGRKYIRSGYVAVFVLKNIKIIGFGLLLAFWEGLLEGY